MRIIPTLQRIKDDNRGKADNYVRNLLKEYLQVMVLRFVYTPERYRDLVFYGGTCLAIVHNLPRLSEDLDFVDIGKKVDVGELARDLEEFFSGSDLDVSVKVQKFRIYLKFGILKELGLAQDRSESDNLFVKVEIFPGFEFCNTYRTEFHPVFKFNTSVLVKTFDLPTLMATKIRAVLYRKWEKTDKQGQTLIQVKGRDYFDLMWFLKQGIEPNLNCIERVKSKRELKDKLLPIIEKLDERSVALDLESFIADKKFAGSTGRNIRQILRRGINEW